MKLWMAEHQFVSSEPGYLIGVFDSEKLALHAHAFFERTLACTCKPVITSIVINEYRASEPPTIMTLPKCGCI